MTSIYENLASLMTHWSGRRPPGRLVFTNGCFDLIHAGHVQYLREASALGDFLVVGLNSDSSVSRLKGPTRPVMPFEDRATVISALRGVNFVVGFDEDTPQRLIETLKPQVLVKGGDWPTDQIVGGAFVESLGGTVRTLGFFSNISTSSIIARIKNMAQESSGL